MKRKLNKDGVPTPVDTKNGSSHTAQTFQAIGLDSRILRAVAKEGFNKPTPVQAQAILPALEGKNILGA